MVAIEKRKLTTLILLGNKHFFYLQEEGKNVIKRSGLRGLLCRYFNNNGRSIYK